MDRAEAMDNQVHGLVTVFFTTTIIGCKYFFYKLEKKTCSSTKKQNSVCVKCSAVRFFNVFCCCFCFSFFFFSQLHRNVSAPVKGRATNNAGEIQSAIRAIWDCANHGFDAVCINTDSTFLIDAVYKWMDRWEQNGFFKANGDPLANRRDFIYLSRALNRNDHMDIYFQHVHAHDGNPYNEEADRLAKEGARQYIPYYN